MKKEERRMKKVNSTRPVRRVSAIFILPSSFSRLLILLVRVYQVTLSPAKAFLFGPAAQCRFEPSCSHYAIEALKTHGALSGGWLAAKRVCRCHPWGECGDDPVPAVKSKVPGQRPKATHSEFHFSNSESRI